MLEKLLEILQKETGMKDLTINEDAVLRTDLEINSYDFVQIICAIEDEFDIEIPDKELARMLTVKDVIEYIEANI